MTTVDRRVKLVCVPCNDVLDWFIGASQGWPRCVSLPTIEGIPPGAKVVAVREDFMSRMFEFLVEHPSFDPVPGMEPPPRVPAGPMEWRTVEVGQLTTVSPELRQAIERAAFPRQWVVMPEEVRFHPADAEPDPPVYVVHGDPVA